MFAGDVFVDRLLDGDEIAGAMSRLFDIPASAVLVVDDVTKVKGRLGEDVRVLCEQVPMTGDFAARLANYMRDPRLEQFVKNNDDKALTERFCTLLNCQCLISDDSANPYSWLLVRGIGDSEQVLLDPNRSDEEAGKIIIKRSPTHDPKVSQFA